MDLVYISAIAKAAAREDMKHAAAIGGTGIAGAGVGYVGGYALRHPLGAYNSHLSRRSVKQLKRTLIEGESPQDVKTREVAAERGRKIEERINRERIHGYAPTRNKRLLAASTGLTAGAMAGAGLWHHRHTD
jgi:hypothetical protein